MPRGGVAHNYFSFVRVSGWVGRGRRAWMRNRNENDEHGISISANALSVEIYSDAEEADGIRRQSPPIFVFVVVVVDG